MAREVSTLGHRVREAREARGMSQQALAMAAGLSMSVVTQIEVGMKQDLKFASVVRLAQALGVSIDVLAGLREDQDTAEERPETRVKSPPPAEDLEPPPAKGKASGQGGKGKAEGKPAGKGRGKKGKGE